MSPIVVPELQKRDSESNAAIDSARQLGLLSCYESRLNATILQRAMDRERARRPQTTKCGRLARAETASGDAAASSKPRTSPATRPRMVQVIARSALATEPA